MATSDLAGRYRGYIDCLNRRDWAAPRRHVDAGVRYNGAPLGLAGYRRMLEDDVAAIPDLRFDIDLLVCEPPYCASRLTFACTPKSELFGLPVNGRRVSFTENVFYRFGDGLIVEVWSVIDKAAVAAQL